MGLRNAPVVWAGRVAKCIDVDAGVAVLVWIDKRDRIAMREVPAAECVRFSDAVRPRSLWPESAIPEDAKEERAARRNRRRVAA